MTLQLLCCIGNEVKKNYYDQKVLWPGFEKGEKFSF